MRQATLTSDGGFRAICRRAGFDPKAEAGASERRPARPTPPIGQFADGLTTRTWSCKQRIQLKREFAFGIAPTAAANRSTLVNMNGKDGGSLLIPGCRLGEAMKRLSTIAAGAAPLLAADTVWAQDGHMMNGGMWGGGWMGGYGGIWGLALLVIVVAAVVAWAVKRK